METDKPLAVVTGASSGIGYALANELADHGFDLVVAADHENITQAATQLAHEGVTVVPVCADLATFEGVQELWGRVEGMDRPVEVVVINAGIWLGGDFTEDIDLESELRLIDLNVRSAVHLAKLALPGMAGRGHGRMLFTSSIAAESPGPYEATYAASKAFLYSFSEAIRHELREAGVTVTALLPGPTQTGTRNAQAGHTHENDPRQVAREGVAALLAGRDHVVVGSLRNKTDLMAAHSAA